MSQCILLRLFCFSIFYSLSRRISTRSRCIWLVRFCQLSFIMHWSSRTIRTRFLSILLKHVLSHWEIWWNNFMLMNWICHWGICSPSHFRLVPAFWSLRLKVRSSRFKHLSYLILILVSNIMNINLMLIGVI